MSLLIKTLRAGTRASLEGIFLYISTGGTNPAKKFLSRTFTYIPLCPGKKGHPELYTNVLTVIAFRDVSMCWKLSTLELFMNVLQIINA